LECLEPLRKFPTNALLQAAAENLFAQTNSPWGRLQWKNNFGRGTIESDLVGVPAYRLLLCRELEKTNACGTITLERPGYVRYNIADLNQSGSFDITLPEDSTATNGATADIRWCDWIAIALAKSKSILPFDPFAAVTNRDSAIRQAILRLGATPASHDK
jgi:hypothetical protein